MMKGQGMMMKQQGKCWQVRIDEQWSVVVQHAAAEVFQSFSSLVWFSSELVQHLTGNAEPKPAIWHKGWAEPILNQFRTTPGQPYSSWSSTYKLPIMLCQCSLLWVLKLSQLGKSQGVDNGNSLNWVLMGVLYKIFTKCSTGELT